jgi:hypothetical protein
MAQTAPRRVRNRFSRAIPQKAQLGNFFPVFLACNLASKVGAFVGNHKVLKQKDLVCSFSHRLRSDWNMMC